MKSSRKTKQKEIIEKELLSMNSFFNADDLFRVIRKKDNAIGIATIYRFLKKKSGDGELHSYICAGKKLYSIGKRNHSHFICKKCGKTSHFNIEEISAIRNSIKGDICHFQLDVYGICEYCKKNRFNIDKS
ncbi:MAG: transcriptional repressor [Candidatus ainarchaeum sp.]|nr:transcriptional repressor [Candidatus ainarchaeum sp.]